MKFRAPLHSIKYTNDKTIRYEGSRKIQTPTFLQLMAVMNTITIS